MRADPGRKAATRGKALAKGAVKAVEGLTDPDQVERLLLAAIQQGHAIGSSLAGSDQVKVVSPQQHAQLAEAIKTAITEGTVPVLVRSEVTRSTVDAYTESTAAKFGKRKLDYVIKTDSAKACAKCKAQAGKKIKMWKSWRGIHANCGCYLEPQPKQSRKGKK